VRPDERTPYPAFAALTLVALAGMVVLVLWVVALRHAPA
jgi:hypothetical protein